MTDTERFDALMEGLEIENIDKARRELDAEDFRNIGRVIMHALRKARKERREALAALRAVFEPEPVQSCKHGYADSSRATIGYRQAKQWYQENKEQ